ncbi:MAG: ComF family protein [Planctomycetes bacterium]|nr:ComF family protein [Planctomycetota bacterium]
MTPIPYNAGQLRNAVSDRYPVWMSIFSLRPQSSPFRLAELLSDVQRTALEFVYPPSCHLCHVELARPASDRIHVESLCSACLTRLVQPAANSCRRCGAPRGPFTVDEDHCLLCRRENYAFDEVIRLGLYRDDLRIACLMAKNPAGRLLSQTLADLLVDAREISFAQPFQAVIPIPEHWIKRLVRPHYAAETIARRISTRLKVGLSTGILAKARWTPKQAKSPPVQRRQQQKSAFRVVGTEVRGKSVLLVDDILTTGATADAAARELKRAGASRVVVAVVAVSPPRV